MAMSRISAQDNVASAATSTATATYPGATTAGNLLIAVVCSLHGPGSNSLTQTGWTQHIDSGYQSAFSSITLFFKTAAGSETTVQGNTGSSATCVSIFEYSGASNPVFPDENGLGNTNSAGVITLSTPGINTQNSSGLIFSVLSANGTITSPSWATSTLIGSNAGITTLRTFCGESITSSAQVAFKDTASWTTTAAAGAVIAAFQTSPIRLPNKFNNYQQLKVGDGMSVSEKIR